MYLCLRIVTAFFKKLVPNDWNGTVVQASCRPCATNIGCLGLAVCIYSIFTTSHTGDKATTADFVSAGIVMSLAVRIIAGCFSSSNGT